MNILSTLRWLFFPNPTDPKHLTLIHPLVSLLLSMFSTSAVFAWLSAKIQKRLKVPAHFDSWTRRFLGPLIIGYLITFLTTRTMQSGTHCLYEGMWICNLCLFLYGIGLMMGNSLLVGACLVAICLDQTLWYLDVLSYILRRKWLIGVASYLVWPDTTYLKIFTTLHHLWFLPLGLFTLRKSGWSWKSYGISVLMSGAITLWSRFLSPVAIQTRNHSTYLNVNQSWAMWKDAAKHFKFLDVLTPQTPFYVTVPIIVTLWFLLSLPFYLGLKWAVFGKKLKRD